jgi:ribonuclease P/MRP protein subunit RPP1
LGQDKAHEAITTEARKCVNAAKLKRSSYRGAIDVIYGGEKPEKPTQEKKENNGGQKRKAENQGENGERPLSKKQQKRFAHEARLKEQAEAKAAKSSSATQLSASHTGCSGGEKEAVHE